jgi:protein-L-isoaspartate(D-aspartate) O-methyltransferase
MLDEPCEKSEKWDALRRVMVEDQLRRRGVRDERVLKALAKIPRHRFVPESLRDYAYDDGPLSIGEGQTISQPYMVAVMTECLAVRPENRVLEVGTGSGYQAAILAELVREVHSIERIPALSERAARLLSQLGCRNVRFHVGDGSLGLPAQSPFDGILVTAGAPEIPAALIDQLAMGGRLVIPIGGPYHQNLYTITRDPEGLHKESVTGCVFVPLIGEQGWEEKARK